MKIIRFKFPMVIIWIITIYFYPLSAQGQQASSQNADIAYNNPAVDSEDQSDNSQTPNKDGGKSAASNPLFSPLIDISGFGDLNSQIVENNSSDQRVQIGQAEIDIEATIGEKVILAIAIAYAPDTETFGLGQFAIDIPLYSNDETHFYYSKEIDRAGFMVGLFDVPFGIDWKVYPSIDRKLISIPLAVEFIHNCWNNYGVQIYAENHYLNSVVYLTNGFDSGIYAQAEIPMSVIIDMAMGGRLGFKPFGIIEIGASHATMFDLESRISSILYGADIQIDYKKFSLKGEYLINEVELFNYESNGFYVTGIYNFDPIFLVARYDQFSTVSPERNEKNRGCLGAGWVILDGFEMRYEYQVSLNNNVNASYLQLVLGF